MTAPNNATQACVSAPGKLMIAGEYAVLRGAPALVAAVNRRARAMLGVQERSSVSPEAQAARQLAEARLGATEGHLAIDVSDLRDAGRGVKLGLGSSAASAAAAAALVFQTHGRDIAQRAVRDEVLEVALKAHQEVSKSGSGADVAAAVLGGFHRVQREGDHLRVEPFPWPEIPMLIIWTGTPASTSEFIDKVEALEGRDPKQAAAILDQIGEASAAMHQALSNGSIGNLLVATRAHFRAMDELGKAASAPIIEDRLALAAHLASEAGGAAKPSGAGGGDAALAFFPDQTAKDRCSKACAKHGLALLSLRLGTAGVRLCEQTKDLESHDNL